MPAKKINIHFRNIASFRLLFVNRTLSHVFIKNFNSILLNEKAYTDICMRVSLSFWMYNWLEYEKVPFMYSYDHFPKTWVGFEDVRSIEYKVRYLIEADFGGAMFFSFSNDDFDGSCDQKPTPLLRVIAFHLNKKYNVSYPNPDLIYNLEEEILSDAKRDIKNQEKLSNLDGSSENSNQIFIFIVICFFCSSNSFIPNFYLF